MNKKVFVLIIFLMSISLIGIIAVQVFWINKSIEMTENQFKSDVSSALIQVSENISDRELNDFYQKLSRFAQNRENITETELKNFFYQQIDTTRQETFEYAQTILEENYKFPMEFFENDSIEFKKIFSKEKVTIVKNVISDSDIQSLRPTENFVKHQELKNIEKLLIENQSQVMLSRLPILQRVSNQEITLNLDRELTQRGITIEYKYGVYNNNFATKLKSGYFRIVEDKSYMIPLFVGNQGESDYQLYVSFPNKNKYFLSSVVKILIISALFILIIILAFVSSLYQMIKQKQISEIKTDFINNMTHEFKTPIATINLALDAIKNPKIIDDKDKVLRYVGMIREENKRMQDQVENVLMISQLDRGSTPLDLQSFAMNPLVEEAISHVALIVQSENGTISSDLKARKQSIVVDKNHFMNVFVNLLDNAIKYSLKAPLIKVRTFNEDDVWVFEIQDHGMGMNSETLKLIFKKFYRQQGGNIHNIKGHGLGLSYVKKIIELHNGTIHVSSILEVGTTFQIRLPIATPRINV